MWGGGRVKNMGEEMCDAELFVFGWGGLLLVLLHEEHV